jgi:large subunit ribosomal protein L3
MRRVGIVVQKVGMSAVFSEEEGRIPVTLLSMSDCVVTAVKTLERDGYVAAQVGVGVVKSSKVSKAKKGMFEASGLEPRRKLKEFVVSPEALPEVGSELKVDHFLKGQLVDVTSVSKGKGFAGVMKRHGFLGLEASHGVSVSHRSHGSTGQRQEPGKVFKGKKMAGHYGDKRVTVQNLRIVHIDVEKGLLAVKGAVPGAVGSYVLVRDAVKRGVPAKAPLPIRVASGE